MVMFSSISPVNNDILRFSQALAAQEGLRVFSRMLGMCMLVIGLCKVECCYIAKWAEENKQAATHRSILGVSTR